MTIGKADGSVFEDLPTEAEFSHGLCPACMRELYPDFYSGEKE